MNIDYQITNVANDDSKTIINLTLASGEQLDIAQQPIEEYFKGKMLADITDSLNKYGQNILERQGINMEQTLINGRYWAIPRYSNVTVWPVWVRGDWLDKYGLKLPTTPEELEIVAKTIHENDPAGNGNTITALTDVFFGPTMGLGGCWMKEGYSVKFKRVVQSISYMPHFLSMVIVAGFVRAIFSPSGGLVNYFVTALGYEPIFFLGSTKYIRSIIIGSGIWKEIGGNTIIYLAAITGIDQAQYEAATVDGANRLQKIIHITLPGMMFTISLLLIMACGGLLEAGFERVFLLYNAGTYKVADIIDTYVYRTGLEKMQYSFASAVGLFKSVLSMTLAVLANWGAKKMGQEGLW